MKDVGFKARAQRWHIFNLRLYSVYICNYLTNIKLHGIFLFAVDFRCCRCSQRFNTAWLSFQPTANSHTTSCCEQHPLHPAVRLYCFCKKNQLRNTAKAECLSLYNITILFMFFFIPLCERLKRGNAPAITQIEPRTKMA